MVGFPKVVVRRNLHAERPLSLDWGAAQPKVSVDTPAAHDGWVVRVGSLELGGLEPLFTVSELTMLPEDTAKKKKRERSMIESLWWAVLPSTTREEWS